MALAKPRRFIGYLNGNDCFFVLQLSARTMGARQKRSKVSSASGSVEIESTGREFVEAIVGMAP